jgi:indole-3-glycerol phosphate synthase
MGRFTQAISEGDGISVIPALVEDVAELGALAGEAGAEAVAVAARDATVARASTSLPLVVDGLQARGEVDELVGAGVDGCIFVYDLDAGEGELLDELYPAVETLGIDCAVEVRESRDLVEILERFDPEILVAASANPNGEDELGHVLDLLADVPAGKLVVARVTGPIAPDQIVALERAGVDAVLVRADVLSQVLAELTGR